MPLSIGIIGLPNVGKSTLFNALTRANAPASNYPFCTVDKNVGVVQVPDPRLEKINELIEPQECVAATIQFIDIAGLVKGASQGEGLGNMFLGHIREVDAVAHVVRCFEDENVGHVEGDVDPIRDVEIVDAELAIADLATAEKAIESRRKELRANPRMNKEQYHLLQEVADGLGRGRAIRKMGLGSDQMQLLREFSFLTAKPDLYVANVGEDDLAGEGWAAQRLIERFGRDKVVCVSSRLEDELADLPPEERREFMEDFGEHESGLIHLIQAGYKLLNYITFYTIANKKLRAWELVAGTHAVDAAGKIHTDMAAGFIRAEVAHYEALLRYGGLRDLRAKGLLRAEGRDYVVQDGDVVEFLFKAP